MREGDILRKVRTSKGLTQKELSTILGISNGFLSNIESGKKSLSKKIISYLLQSKEISNEEKEFLSIDKLKKGTTEVREKFLKKKENELKKLELELMRKQYKINTVDSKYALKGDIRDSLIKVNSTIDSEIAVLEILFSNTDNDTRKYFSGSIEVTINKLLTNVSKLKRLQQESDKIIEIY